MRTTINRKMLAPALLVLLAIASGASAELVGLWTFENVKNGIVADQAGGDDNGTLLGGTSIVVVGAPLGGTTQAAKFSAVGDQIELVETGNLSPGADPWSYASWFQLDGTFGERGACLYGERGGTGTWGPAALVISISPAGELDLFFRDLQSQNVSGVSSGLGIQNNVWYHLAVVRDGGTIKAYLNGELAWELSGTLNDMNMEGVDETLPQGNYPRFGAHPDGPIKDPPYPWQFSGLMDDVRIYNHALTKAEVAESMQPPPRPTNPALAREPQPADMEASAIHKAVLTWTPGDYAPAINGHRLYFSESFEDVNDGLDTTLIGIQSAARYPESGTGALKFGQTYFWRVDEANDVSGWDIGNVWRFTVEPESVAIAAEAITVTASSTEQGKSPASTADGSGLDKNDLHSTQPADMWLSGVETGGAWIEYAFDKAYTLHEMWVWNYNQVGFEAIGGAKDVIVEYSINGTDYVALEGVNEFAVAPGGDGYAHNTVVDFAGFAAKSVRIRILSNWAGAFPVYGLSEVRFYYIPVWARDPVPAPDANDVNPEPVVLGWKQGRQAASHDVYLGTSEDALDFVGNTSDSYLDVGTLDLGQTYYWRVDEVNEADDPAVWEGELWGFTVSDFIPVDDFESYTNDDASGKAIWQTWVDGYDVPDNGSQVGNFYPPYAEQTTVHDGAQSLSLHYTNTSGVTKSEATRTFDEPQDLTRANIGDLSLWFQGHPGAAGVATKLSSDSYSISATGAGIGGEADEFHLAYQQTSSGENIIIAKIDSIDSEADGAKAGIMLRDTLDTDSRYAMVAVTPSGGIVFQWRMDIGMLTQNAIVEGTAPCWLKLERTGIGYCRAYHSPDGTEGSWVQLGESQLIFMAAPAAGLAMTSGDVAEASEATFSGITINGAAPADLVSQDIASISNDAEPVYVALEDADGDEVIVVHEDPDATLTPLWQEWRINLSQLVEDNARFDLTTVSKMTLGVGARDAATDGGSGVLYVDDIRLYPTVIQ